MKKIYTLCLGILLSLNVNSQVAVEWQKCYGGSGGESASSILSTNDGGYIIAGTTSSDSGMVSGFHGFIDYWLVKIDSLGQLQWQKCFGGSSEDRAEALDKTFDGGYIVAGITFSNDGDITYNNGNYDIWVVKTDSTGNLQWQKSYGGSFYETAKSIKQTTDGGYIIAGLTNSNNGDVTGNQGGTDAWIIKIDSLGNIQWQKCIGGTSTEWANSIVQTYDGGYIFTGMSESNDGDISGNHISPFGFNTVDVIVVKLNNSGIIQWQKSLGGTGDEEGFSIRQTNDGGFIIGGNSSSSNGDLTTNNGNEDFWIVKVDSLGTIQWQKSHGDYGTDICYSIIQTIDNGFIATGYSMYGGSLGMGDSIQTLTIKLDFAGNLQWDYFYGGYDWDSFSSVIQNMNSYILAGGTSSNDSYISGNNGGGDFLIVKLTTDFNLTTGNIFVDLNNNTIQDVGEPTLKNKNVSENNTGRFSISDANGFYNLSVLDTGNFSISPTLLTHYTAVPATHSAYFSAMNQTDSLNNFAFQPNGVINDLQVTINPVGAFRPGFDAYYNIHYKNVGTTSISGSIILKQDSVLSYISSPITPTSFTTDSVVWNIPTLNPFDDGNILVTVNVSTGAVLGSTVNSIARIEPVTGDAIPADNESTWQVTVTGSYDPNDILVNRETVTTTELISPPFLDYLIRFQNTGTDTAFTVKISNPLPVNAQLNSFEFLESSHPVQLNYSNAEQLMWYQFDNILLPDSNTNELLSHGYVRYRIKPKTTLTIGDLIENSASIFFDFNAPIYTNTAVTEIVLPSSIPGIKNNFDFSIFPNPSLGEVNISFTLKEEKEIKIELFNSLGQVVKTIYQQKITSGKNQINFSTENLSKGIYHIKFSVGDDVVTRKLVKM